MAKKQTIKEQKPEQKPDAFDETFDFFAEFDESNYVEEVVATGAEYWDFKLSPRYIGAYQSPVIAREDQKDKADGFKKGDVIGYNFVTAGSGQDVIIQNNYLIEQALKDAAVGSLWKIHFLGKKESNGNVFSNFRIVKLIAK